MFPMTKVRVKEGELTLSDPTWLKAWNHRWFFSDGGTFAGEGSRSGLGIVASGIADANTVRSESVGACPSFSAEDVQFACTDAEADQMVYEGGSEVATIL